MLLYGVLAILFILSFISFIRPNWGVAIFLFLCIFFTDYFLIRISLESLTEYPLKILLAASVAIGCLFRVIKKGKTSFGSLTQDIILLILLGYCVLVTLISLLGRYAFAVNVILLVHLGMMAVLYFSIINVINTSSDIERIAWAIIIGSIIVSIFSTWDLLQGYEKRGFGIAGENATGFFCSIALPFVFGLIESRRFKKKITNFLFLVLYGCIISFLILAVLVSGSRGGLVAVAVALILSIGLIRIRWRDGITLGMTLVGICFLVVITGFVKYLEFSSWKFRTFLAHITNLSLPADSNVIARIKAIIAGFDTLGAHPIFGVGPGVFRIAEWNIVPENLYIQILVGYGVAGFSIALVLGFLVLKTFWRALREAKRKHLYLLANWTTAMAVSYVAMLVFGLTNDLFYEVYPWFFFAISATCFHISSLSKINEERK